MFEKTNIPDVLIFQPHVFGDERGFNMEAFRSDLFAASGIAEPFLQDNHSGSQQGVLRGLHYQIRQTQGKLVRAIVGEIFDVAVDLRRSSVTFGQWVGSAGIRARFLCAYGMGRACLQGYGLLCPGVGTFNTLE
jgi:dTDP-4-dehydrorhamnose 3,5-epimerase